MAIAAQWQNELTGMALSIYESTMEKIYVRKICICFFSWEATCLALEHELQTESFTYAGSKLNVAWHVWVAIKALAAALFFHLLTNKISLIYKLPHFLVLWDLVGCTKAVVVLGLKWQITGSKWSGSSRTARSDLAGLLPDTKQSTSLSPTVMVTTHGDGAAILCFLAEGSASCWSNKLLPWSLDLHSGLS
jgi:hypothetical protein